MLGMYFEISFISRVFPIIKEVTNNVYGAIYFLQFSE